MLFASRSTAFVTSTLVVPLALVLFAIGFFPYKPFISGLATFNGSENVLGPPPVFDRLIFMVIDALRSDFVYSNHTGFEFTQELIRSGAAIPFTAHATAPTVTMPRVKAITTGSVPSFADVILNIAESESMSTLANQDTWLRQLKERPDGRLVMYGDDTWLNLFPGMFDRHDGTSSFFVSDFTEVDNNVTRHVPDELTRDDWSAMIMHYLGLDHIGHKSGPNSVHMIPKQREMDGIVRDVYTAMNTTEHLKSTLFILCGDHGMNDAGNHGGASAGETSPALTFISPKLQTLQMQQSSPAVADEEFQYYQTIEQSDITPTLAGLLGIPVSLNNLGVFVPDFLPLWSDRQHRLRLLSANAKQILNVVQQTFPGTEFVEGPSVDLCAGSQNTDISRLQCSWQKATRLLRKAEANSSHAVEAESSLLQFSRAAQDIMSKEASNYNLNRLYQGAGLALLATVLSAVSCFVSTLRVTGCTAFFGFLVGGYGALMFASSYVEEEQQFWYWMLTGWQFYLYTRCYKSKSGYAKASPLFLAALSRVARRWNQTGQKFAAEPDITRPFLKNHATFLWILILLTYTDIYQRLRPPNDSSGVAKMLRAFYLPLTSFAFVFKLSFAAADSPELLKGVPLLAALAESVSKLSLVVQAQLIFLGVSVAFAVIIYHKLKPPQEQEQDTASSFHSVLTLFILTQSRPTNVPLYAIFRIQQAIIGWLGLSDAEITVTSVLMQYASFFALGGSNSIASVDLSNAYNGVSSYNVIMVGLLTFVSNWAGPIWWVSATYSLFYSNGKRTLAAKRPKGHVPLLTMFASASVLAVMVACTMLRTHLFVWTVFSPKFLYTAVWTLKQHLVVNLLWGEFFLRRLYK